MSKEFPSLMDTLVHERDQYMASSLLRVASEHTSVVSVIGRGHIQGIKKHWKQPITIVTEYKKDQLPLVMNALEKMHAHLTAAIVSNDPIFIQEVIGNSVNGTTYAGLRGRTTGAPHPWFGPAGDARGAGIGTPEAIKLVWSCHRDIIYDYGPVPQRWEVPPSI